MREWPLWEIFIRSQHGLAHKHVGSLHAPDGEMAINHARDVYTRRNEGVSVWVVKAADVVASSPGDMEPEAMTPNPPAFDSADTRCRSDTQVMAPPMIAISQPRKARPRSHSWSRRRRGMARFMRSPPSLAPCPPPCPPPQGGRE